MPRPSWCGCQTSLPPRPSASSPPQSGVGRSTPPCIAGWSVLDNAVAHGRRAPGTHRCVPRPASRKALGIEHTARLTGAAADRQTRSSSGWCSTSCVSTAITFTLDALIDRLLGAAGRSTICSSSCSSATRRDYPARPARVGAGRVRCPVGSTAWAGRGRGCSTWSGRVAHRCPNAVWSPLFLAAEEGLVTRSGLFGFATDAHRKAGRGPLPVHRRRQGRGPRKRSPTTSRARTSGTRVVDELPWQQLGGGDLDGLVRHLGPRSTSSTSRYRRSLPDVPTAVGRGPKARRAPHGGRLRGGRGPIPVLLVAT